MILENGSHTYLAIDPDVWQSILKTASVFGWSPQGTTHEKPSFRELWVGGQASYHAVGAIIGTHDGANLAVALLAAWRALRQSLADGTPGPALDRTDYRLMVQGIGAPRGDRTEYPLAGIRKSGFEVQGILWAAAVFVARGGLLRLVAKATGEPAMASVRMLSGVSLESGAVAVGDVIKLPLLQAGYYVASGRAEDSEGALAAA
jgi:hypothetical protein